MLFLREKRSFKQESRIFFILAVAIEKWIP